MAALNSLRVAAPRFAYIVSIGVVDDLHKQHLIGAIPRLVVIHETLNYFTGQLLVIISRTRGTEELHITGVHSTQILKHFQLHRNARMIGVDLHMGNYFLVIQRASDNTMRTLSVRATSRCLWRIDALNLRRALPIEHQTIVNILEVREVLLELVLHLQVSVQHVLLHRVPLLISSALLGIGRRLRRLCLKIKLKHSHLSILITRRFGIGHRELLPLCCLVRRG